MFCLFADGRRDETDALLALWSLFGPLLLCPHLFTWLVYISLVVPRPRLRSHELEDNVTCKTNKLKAKTYNCFHFVAFKLIITTNHHNKLFYLFTYCLKISFNEVHKYIKGLSLRYYTQE